MAGKGSAPRPFSVSKEEYEKRWDKIFKKPVEEKPKEPTKQDTPNKV